MSVVSRDIHRAVRVVKRGGVLVYPTETFWALGGSACSSEAVLQTARIKNRPPDKPLPVVIGCMEHLSAFFRPRPEELQIAALFWPGPLSIVVRGGPDLAPVLADSRGRVSVRWSAHAAACGLAVQTGVPLVSTSANPSGRPPAREFIELHKDIKDRADLCFVSEEVPAGGMPSTVVEVTVGMSCTILRPGKVGREDFLKKGVNASPPPDQNSRG